MVNTPLKGCSTENGATHQELTEKLPISGKDRWKLLLEIEKEESKERAELEQRK